MAHLSSRQDAVSRLREGSAEDWLERQAYVRRTMKETIFAGLPPNAEGPEAATREARWPLNATITKRTPHPQLNATV